ncbi:uncharacterized protein PAC_17760 [Phialocephala subalpina]|uniref:Uncharacterized protein n=1 Tax=Phialocephala subalpina TaxID=576137 RepID=A0A1L7XS33_9HELO|nr:uncharacterized protein PAC_17760 [Phialocephala subalpina]
MPAGSSGIIRVCIKSKKHGLYLNIDPDGMGYFDPAGAGRVFVATALGPYSILHLEFAGSNDCYVRASSIPSICLRMDIGPESHFFKNLGFGTVNCQYWAESLPDSMKTGIEVMSQKSQRDGTCAIEASFNYPGHFLRIDEKGLIYCQCWEDGPKGDSLELFEILVLDDIIVG